ncbi:hypothetical protein OCU04_012611 [Sclerotinia nivalis]|uniref:Uncharacterized protein n=1 Tax=Sclerotinia nivalis TaxID=352851 RepID=A0A9X0A998_9HELO|nr:hypothetical protein OCU04_012611 [Sclerotinia nivalis]
MFIASQDTLTVAAIWAALPFCIRGDLPQPLPGKDMTLFLTKVLDDVPKQSWETSLAKVSDLRFDMTAMTAARITDEDLFDISDVPQFTDCKDYWSYRWSLKRFFGCFHVNPTQIKLALYKVLCGFSGNAAPFADRFDIKTIARTNFASSASVFLSELDRLFFSLEFLHEKNIEFRRCRPKKGQSAREFLLDFETVVCDMREASNIAGTPMISQIDVIYQLLAVLPSHVRNAVCIPHKSPERLDIFDFRSPIERVWNNTSASAVVPSAPARTDPGPRFSQTAPNNDSLLYGTCNKPCWDTTPAVPANLRGQLRKTNSSRSDLDGFCIRCRRSASDHNGRTTGCVSYGGHTRHSASAPASQQQSENSNEY